MENSEPQTQTRVATQNDRSPRSLPVVTCRLCGSNTDANFIEPTRSDMLKESLCFNCLFWTQLARVADGPDKVRVNGVHYQICKDATEVHAFRGFGGRKFSIQFNDGRYQETNNLWCQGAVPAAFLSQLPDNARFVTKAEGAPSVHSA